jgi:pantoate--beta-alanine ligase
MALFPQLITTVAELRQVLSAVRAEGKKIGLVPTMGALHAGHLSLVQASQAECGFTVVTIYVNPSQFGPSEDFRRYPRTLQKDMKLVAGAADLVFSPSNEEVYPAGYATWVEVGSVAQPLEGQCRPGHFRGVATIVLKLFNMVDADVAYFGQKDFQQALVIRRMVEDLQVPITLRVCPIVREPDGLAMSSRNAYLSPESRQQALVLSKSLVLAQDLLREGERRSSAILHAMEERIRTVPVTRIDYISLVEPETLEPVEEIRGPTLAALAVVIGQTRLIDNCLLIPNTET